MLRSGGVATLMFMINNSIKYLVGNNKMDFNCIPLHPFDDLICEFLNGLSIELLNSNEVKKYSDIISFAFWCRKGNIEKLKEKYYDKDIRLGRGIAFHITPSNVPINFAFSFAFSLLSGNGNIVRVPSKDYPQISIVCKAINKLFYNKRFKQISRMTIFVRYAHDDEITADFSKKCNARIIWGSNDTIKSIRKIPIPERSIEVIFADRYSFCIIDSESINNADNLIIKKLIGSFYNDTYLMDQNACSSPKLLIWFGNEQSIKNAKQKFWKNVYKVVTEKYEFKSIYAVDKYTQLCEDSINYDFINSYSKYGNYIYCINLNKLPNDTDNLRGKCGYFYQYDTNNLNDIIEIINTKYQTLTYFGISKMKLAKFVLSNNLTGIDRIVPIGSALDISIIWDGYDLVRTLSRIIDIK